MSHDEDHPLRQYSAPTLRYYDQAAADFWEGTRTHDVRQNVRALLDACRGEAPLRLLDLGCGPGRDLRTFLDLGHDPVGLEGAPQFVRMAREHSGCEVLHQDFLRPELPAAHFDGIFANATLQHVPSAELNRVLEALARALVPEGVLFVSVPHGANQEGFHGERFSFFADHPTWQRYLDAAGFREEHHYYRPPGRPRAEQPWLAMVWRKTS